MAIVVGLVRSIVEVVIVSAANQTTASIAALQASLGSIIS
ncbi:hypothetical protein PMIT1313_00761 [Prochlorococcus marinus str. MIT 1313]|nr:hypothetical protein PMIT1313_00761 [Prochlorococcus marinus str. MIT 1313]KZR72834.1 hypothetical protein PMIT1318_00800 [Prochlorococcus marinus str. MIT 1318]